MRFLKNYLRQFTGLPSSCWKGILFCFAQTSIGSIFYYISIYLIYDLHYTISKSGVILSSYGFGAIAGGYFGGSLSDHYSPRFISAISLTIQAAAILSLLIFKNHIYLMGILFVLGFSVYSFISSNYTYILNHCGNNESDRLKAINLLSTSSNLGLGVSALLIGALSGFGFDKVFLFSGIILFFLGFYNVKIHGEKNIRAVKSIIPADKNEVQPNFRYKVNVILTCVLLSGLMIAQVSATYPIYIKDKFPLYGIQGFSILFALNSLLIILFQTPLVNYFGRFNHSIVMGAGGFLLGFGMLCFSFSSQFILMLTACAIYTFGEMLFFSMAQLSCYQYAPSLQKGKNLGLFRMTFATSRMIGPMMGGYIFQHLGGDVLWYTCGIIGAFCLMLCGTL